MLKLKFWQEIYFCIVAKINKDTNKERYSGSEFLYI